MIVTMTISLHAQNNIMIWFTMKKSLVSVVQHVRHAFSPFISISVPYSARQQLAFKRT